MTKDDGGPAFPACNEANVNGTMGMSLRDWFAGQALCSIPLRNWDVEGRGDEEVIRQWARTAYIVADEMISHRKAD